MVALIRSHYPAYRPARPPPSRCSHREGCFMPVTWRDLVRQIEMYCLRFEMDGSLRAPCGGPRSTDSLRIPARIGRRFPSRGRGSRGVGPPVPLGRSLPLTLHQQHARGAPGDAAVRQVPDFRRLDPTAATPEAGPSRRPAVRGDDSWGRGRTVGHGGAPFGWCGAGHASGQQVRMLVRISEAAGRRHIQ
jgi:hypothetical protein